MKWKDIKKFYADLLKLVVDNTINGTLTVDDALKLQKMIRSSKRFAFLESKLKWINWSMLISWFTIMGFVGWEISGQVEFQQILALVVNGLATLIPVVFVAEGVAIYRSMKVNVKPEEIMEMLSKHKGDK